MVGIPVLERVLVTDCVYDAVVVIDLVKGRVVAIPDFDLVRVTD